jgi:hypothetical protein
MKKRPEVGMKFSGHERDSLERAPTVDSVFGEERACPMGDIGENGEIFGKDSSVVELERGQVTLWVDCAKVAPILSPLVSTDSDELV